MKLDEVLDSIFAETNEDLENMNDKWYSLIRRVMVLRKYLV